MQPVPPATQPFDLARLEARVLALAEILDQAVAEARRTAQEIRKAGGSAVAGPEEYHHDP